MMKDESIDFGGTVANDNRKNDCGKYKLWNEEKIENIEKDFINSSILLDCFIWIVLS